MLKKSLKFSVWCKKERNYYGYKRAVFPHRETLIWVRDINFKLFYHFTRFFRVSFFISKAFRMVKFAFVVKSRSKNFSLSPARSLARRKILARRGKDTFPSHKNDPARMNASCVHKINSTLRRIIKWCLTLYIFFHRIRFFPSTGSQHIRLMLLRFPLPPSQTCRWAQEMSREPV